MRHRRVDEVWHAEGWNADRIDQSVRLFNHTRQWIAGAQFTCDRLGNKGPEPVEIDHLLQPFGKGTGRWHDGIAQCEAADRDREVDIAHGGRNRATPVAERLLDLRRERQERIEARALELRAIQRPQRQWRPRRRR